MITIDHTEPCCRCGHTFEPCDARYANDIGGGLSDLYCAACYEKKFGK